MRSLEGQLCLVTGIANENSIATAITGQLLQEGASVVASVLDERTAIKVPRLLARKEWFDPDRFKLVICNFSSEGAIDELIHHFNPESLRCIVHCIAYMPASGMGEDWDDASYEDVEQGFRASAISLPALIRRTVEAQRMQPDWSSVIALSYLPERVSPGYGHMHAAKAALESYARVLAVEYGHLGMRINVLQAGPQRTLAARGIPHFADFADQMAAAAPLGWDLDDKTPVAEAATALLKLRGVTGHALRVDGGYSLLAAPQLS